MFGNVNIFNKHPTMITTVLNSISINIRGIIVIISIINKRTRIILYSTGYFDCNLFLVFNKFVGFCNSLYKKLKKKKYYQVH